MTTPTAARALDASLDRAALTEATSRRRTIDLLGEVLETEARVAALADHAQTLREVLLARGREHVATEGMAPTWRSEVGSVVLSIPKAKLAVTDREAFTTWVARTHREHVTVVARLTHGQAEQIGNVLAAAGLAELAEVLEEAAAREVDTTWERELLKGGVALNDGVVFAPETGEELPGVTLLPAGQPTLSVRPDAEVKARLIAEVRAQVLALLPPVVEVPMRTTTEHVSFDVTVAEQPAVTELLPALAGDPVEDLVVDPAEGVVRVGMDHAQQDRLVVAHADGAVEVLDLAGDAGPEPDHDDAPADPDAGPRWHAEQLAALPRLAFTLNAYPAARLRELAGELGLEAFEASVKRPAMAKAVRARIEALTTPVAAADVAQAEGGQA